MTECHFILQGKGGAGKSTCAMFLADYFSTTEKPYIGVDTDPVNRSFFDFSGLNVEVHNISDDFSADAFELDATGRDPSLVSVQKMDQLVDLICKSDADVRFIVDVGSSAYLGMLDYFTRDGGFDNLIDNDVAIFIHCIIAGGKQSSECLAVAEGLLEATSMYDLKFILWSNPHGGGVDVGGKRLSESIFVEERRDAIAGVVQIPRLRLGSHGHDLNVMLVARKTFAECVNAREIEGGARSRLRQVRKGIHAAIEQGAGL